MRDFQKGFYNTKAWQNCRNNYLKFRGGLCERCLERGLIVEGEIVHHKVHLNPYNILVPSVSLNFDNLELLCRQCHSDTHYDNQPKRYTIGADGSVIT